ncbi:alpha/beta fold hydrolase [Bradyrhizobium sp. 156]|uniref:alpha/beta fold hydrolase n=1 Tax=Bradyrhizobium sp. 156 TaxID=2782630 RepID=UPI001FFA5DA8|nr:alpha/beta fold hydrolase [Bradyrhizobium sp. 156]MCK1323593.1 alpha/beta fold hydrolase [Bradyrhizobium sp. 156]
MLLREQTPSNGDRSHPVLYIHGASFPSALSMMFPFQGKSWADSLNEAGFDVFALDFAGYGGSERYPEMEAGQQSGAPLGRAPAAAEQIERAVRFISRATGASKVDIIAHSWGTIPAGLFSGKHPELVRRLVLFGPIAQRSGPPASDPPKAWQLVTIAEQHARFVRTVPPGEPGVLEEADFPAWAKMYLDSDAQSSSRMPPAVMVPYGPQADVEAAWSGSFPYDVGTVRAPTLIIRGEWDRTSPDEDVEWLKVHLRNVPRVEIVKVPRATHLMHLESGRKQLYAEVEKFLKGGDQSMRTIAKSLFAVVFEVEPDPEQKAQYLEIAGGLRPVLEKMAGFIMNERFRSRRNPLKLLSLSLWDDEKALVRWRTVEQHHRGQVRGRAGVLSDYHLRVGEVEMAIGDYSDRQLGWMTNEETEVSDVKALTVVDRPTAPPGIGAANCEMFDHLTSKGRVAVLCRWPTVSAAKNHIESETLPNGASAYVIRVIRDYGKADRREAPQFME